MYFWTLASRITYVLVVNTPSFGVSELLSQHPSGGVVETGTETASSPNWRLDAIPTSAPPCTPRARGPGYSSRDVDEAVLVWPQWEGGARGITRLKCARWPRKKIVGYQMRDLERSVPEGENNTAKARSAEVRTGGCVIGLATEGVVDQKRSRHKQRGARRAATE